jgi:hypothetical protein
MTAPTLAGELIATVVDAARYAPRNRQTAIGPSEVGHPCNRRLAYRAVETKRLWADSDPWASIVGVAVHAWLASAFAAENLMLDEPRWLVEQRVHATPGLPGSCDLYDLHTDTVIDHKVVGTATMASAKAKGPSTQYRVQANLYGLGWERLGRQPKEVAIAYWPRTGFLSGLYLHREPYDRELAAAALQRYANVSAAALACKVDEDPMNARLIPSEPSDECRYCPYKSSTPDDGGCPDAPRKQQATGVPGIT